MLKKSQKIIVSIIIFGLFFGLVSGTVLKPEMAKATDGGGSLMTSLKELVLDTVGWAVTDQILNPLIKKIQDWGMGKTSDSNEPLVVVKWDKFFDEIKNVASAKFVQEFRLTPLCAPIRVSLEGALGIDLPMPIGGISTYRTYGACTIGNIVDNVEEFYDNPSISVYGWDSWTALMQPNNNFIGSFLMAQKEKARIEEEEAAKKDKEVAVSNGVKNETICNQSDQEACAKDCTKYPATLNGYPNAIYLACIKSCEKSSTGVCIQETVKNVGRDINKSLNDAMGKDMQRIISADEISELIGVMFSAVLNKAINGVGLAFSSKSSSAAQINKNELKDRYGYGGQKPLTPEEIKGVYSTVLTGVLKGGQMLAGANRSCMDEESMLNNVQLGNNYYEIYAAQLEALYVGTTGAALQPNYEVLDPSNAPFTVNGYGYGKVPVNKIPEKCKKTLLDPVTQKAKYGTCKDIKSGLEPKFDALCTECMYDGSELNCPPAPYPPLSKIEKKTVYFPPPPREVNVAVPIQLTEGQIEAKQSFYNSCVGQYEQTQIVCIDCIKKANERCNQDDAKQKEDCINNTCNNYDGIKNNVISKITSGLDFYKKCSIEEQKTSCFTCLKEYLMPANYCDQIKDYMSRAMVKYPNVVFQLDVNDGRSIGPYDPSFDEAYGGAGTNTDCDNDEGENRPVPVDLICRIMPDYTYGGEKICETKCFANAKNPMTTEELNDITDFRPTQADCNNATIPIGGRIGIYNFLNDSVFLSKGKCCAAIWGHDYDRYSKCVGQSSLGIEPSDPPPQVNACGPDFKIHPERCCSDGWRPVTVGRSGFTDAGLAPWGGDCYNTQFSTGNSFKFYMHVNNNAYSNDVTFITDSSSGGTTCSETTETLNNTDQQPLSNPDWDGDQGNYELDDPPSTTDASAATGTLWEQELEKDSDTGTKAQLCLPALSPGKAYIAGTYHNDSSDMATGFQVCAQCVPGDPNNVIDGIDQCNNKEEGGLEVPTECQ